MELLLAPRAPERHRHASAQPWALLTASLLPVGGPADPRGALGRQALGLVVLTAPHQERGTCLQLWPTPSVPLGPQPWPLLGAGFPEPQSGCGGWAGTEGSRKGQVAAREALEPAQCGSTFPADTEARGGCPSGLFPHMGPEPARAGSEWMGRAAHAAGLYEARCTGPPPRPALPSGWAVPLPQRRCWLPGAGKQTALEDRPRGWAVLTSLGPRGPCSSPAGVPHMGWGSPTPRARNSLEWFPWGRCSFP